jgi:hypothetical protein
MSAKFRPGPVSVVVSVGLEIRCTWLLGRARRREKRESQKQDKHWTFSLCCVLVRSVVRGCRMPPDGF